MDKTRIAWVDYAKGLCIIMVVMMHATLSWENIINQHGWLRAVVEFARPFRMPDFFLIAGLFLGRSINAPLKDYLDRKVVHFIYFYLLWCIIQMLIIEGNVLTSDPAQFGRMVLIALTYEPYETLWFVHMLAIFYLVTRWVRRVPVLIVFTAAAALQIIYHTHIFDAGWTVNRFCDRYVYFFIGYAASARIFDFAEIVRRNPQWAMVLLLIWGLSNELMVLAGMGDAPGPSLLMGFIGAAAVVSFGVLLSQVRVAKPLAYVGANSIVVYLTFPLAEKTMQKILLYTHAIPDVGTASAAITAVAVIVPLMFHYAIKKTPLNFLYVRPRAFRLIKPPRSSPPIAEPSGSAA